MAVTKNPKCLKTYINDEGKTANKPFEGMTGINFAVCAEDGLKDTDGKPVIVDTQVISFAGLSDKIRFFLMGHGLSQKIGDSYAGGKKDVLECIIRTKELLAGDEWLEAGEGSALRPSMVFDAVLAVLIGKGAVLDDDKQKALRESLAVKGARESALKNPDVKAEFESMKAANAVERAKKAAEAAKKAAQDETVKLDDFMSAFMEAEPADDQAPVAE